MVNQTILDYLRNYGKSFSLDDLRKKILAGGYSGREFDEAAGALGLTMPEAKISAMPEFVQKSSGARWMRFAGIIGIVFLIISAMSFIASFFISSIMPSGGIPLAVSIAILIVFLLVFVSCLFFLKGFARMGRYTSRLLRFSSITLIIFNIAVFVLSIAAAIIVLVFAGDNVSPLTGAATLNLSSFGADSAGLGGMSSVTSFGAAGWSILITVILIAIFFVVINTLFFIGLIMPGKQARFAKLAGILGVVLIGVAILAGLYIFSNPFLMIGMLISGTAKSVLLVTQILFYALSMAVLLFETLTLFDASKKFENSGY